MRTGFLQGLLGQVRAAVRAGGPGAPADAELLRRWVQGGDESAFELLVWRHGRLVLSVCRRLLHDEGEIEDAFQATFLVLVRKAASISRQQAVAAWLHKVAYRVALEARARSSRHPLAGSVRLDELEARGDPGSESGELLRVIDEEVSRLPEKYRQPFILCHLQGRTNEEAARELDRPLGTILSRLARARERLRQRLARRGLAPALVLGGEILGEQGRAVAPPLVSSTVRTAVAVAATKGGGEAVSATAVVLMEGVLRTMLIVKMKVAAAVVLSAVVLGVGGGMTGYRAVVAQNPAGQDPRTLEEQISQVQRELELTQERSAVLKDRLGKLVDWKAKEALATLPTLQAANRPKASGVENLQELEDREKVELLQARLKIKEAELKAAQSMKEESERRHQMLVKARTAVRGAIAPDDLAAAWSIRNRYVNEELVKTAELEEAKLLLRQAQRRIAARVAAAPTLEERIKVLEKKVADLEAELRKSRGKR